MMKTTMTMAGLLFPLIAFAQASGSHGGDTLVMEFTGSQINIAEWYQKRGPLPSCVMPSVLLSSVQGPNKIKVTSVPITFVGSTEVDAATDPNVVPAQTLLSRTRMIGKPKDKGYALLALHEIYVANRIEKTNDTSFSKPCLDQMLRAGLNLTTALVEFKPFKSVIELIASKRASIQCEMMGAESTLIQVTIDRRYLEIRGNHNRKGSRKFGKHTGYSLHSPNSDDYIDFQSVYNMMEGRSELIAEDSFRYHGMTMKSVYMKLWSQDGIRYQLTLFGDLDYSKIDFNGTNRVTMDCGLMIKSAP